MDVVKRREPLNLAHVLEDRSPSAIPVPIIEKRIHTRFDKAFLVVIGSELYGDTFAVARNISAGGILVEMTYAPPLGTVVTVHFQHTHEDDQLDELVVRAEVKHHHYLNFTGGNDAASARAIGLRFLEFVDPDERIPPDRWH
jgi:PilZ domain-containing protein